MQTAKQKGTTDSEPIKQDESRWFTHHVFSVLEMFWDFSASKGVLFVSNFQNTRDFIILRRCSSKKKKNPKNVMVQLLVLCLSVLACRWVASFPLVIFPFCHPFGMECFVLELLWSVSATGSLDLCVVNTHG